MEFEEQPKYVDVAQLVRAGDLCRYSVVVSTFGRLKPCQWDKFKSYYLHQIVRCGFKSQRPHH